MKSKPSKAPRGMRTQAIHAGEPRPPVGDAISMPIFQSSTYLLGEPESFDDIRYIRLNNTPNHQSVGAKLAALEGSESAVVSSSGTSAISMALMAFLEAGDHVVAPYQMYGGTRKILVRMMKRCGVEVTFVPYEDPEAWRQAVRPSTKIFYLESITNPLLHVGPLDQVVDFAKERGLMTVIDNTLPTPVSFRPIEMGFDLVVHSASKYLNGHSDVVAGVVAGSHEQVETVRKMMNLAGVCLDPNSCVLLQRGLKTLPVRVPWQNDSAMALARALHEHELVERVYYPGLVDDPSHERASKWFGGYGAMVSFVPKGGLKAADALLHLLQYGQIAPSLGGVETLVSRPATTSHSGLPEKVREEAGISDDVVRVSVGLEDADDLIQDFFQALAKSHA